jgi:hypothetical protein
MDEQFAIYCAVDYDTVDYDVVDYDVVRSRCGAKAL